MRTRLYKMCLWAALAFIASNSIAQPTYVTTVPPLSGGNGQSGVTFNVQVFNDVDISEIWASFGSSSSQTVEVWYHPTDSINGVPTVTTGNGWVSLGAITFTPTTSGYGTIDLIPYTSLNLNLIGGNTYGFFISSTATINYTTGPSSSGTQFSDANLSINTGTNAGYGGNPPSSAFYIRQYNGKIGYDLAGPPCPGPTGLTATNVLSTSADVSWSAVAGSVGYDYVVDQNPTYGTTSPPVTNTTATSASISTLTPGTTYYLHVRNYCTAIKKSPWSDYSFTTLPPCNKPSNFTVTSITPATVNFQWAPLASANSWDYVIDQNNAIPAGSTGTTNTLTPNGSATGLQENTWYYVHIKTNCTGEESDWSLDSFLTPIPCRAPIPKVDYINTDEAVIYWDSIPTSYTYEYAITKSSTPPAIGTKYPGTSMHTSALLDGATYYMHVRSYCNSIGILDVSPWATVSFKTFALSVSNVNGKQFNLVAYPNPVTDVLNISFTDGKISTSAQLMLCDISGKVLQNISIDDSSIEVDMKGLAPGIYMLRYTDEINNKLIKVEKL